MRMAESYEAIGASHVLTLEEITNLTEEGGKPADTLMNVVALIASRFNTDVCSAYLLEPDRSNLVLAATLGLHPRLSRYQSDGYFSRSSSPQ
jgi:glycogen phosphorylase